MYEQRGRRCNVCTGCGRCPGVRPGISVIMKHVRKAEVLPIPDRDGRRLVTVDIGTTTIAMQLYGEDGRVKDSFACVNPQTGYGADVLSRIRRAEQEEAARDMGTMVREVLGRGFERFRKLLSEGESLFAVIAANTTMVYLLMGYDPRELGRAPFHATYLEGGEISVAGTSCVIFPGLSAFVGGDIVAGIHACGMAEKEERMLLVDLGTNGEMVLGNKNGLIACATAAGPAFEGGVNSGVWGSDMISILARLKKEGFLDDTGLIAEPYFETGIRIGDVRVTQEAVRAIQLAKGAVRAGIEILAKQAGIGFEDIDKVVLAGGFGYYLDPEAAAGIGLLPPELAGKTVTGGNTALAGALRLGREILVTGTYPKLPGCDAKVINLAEIAEFKERYIGYLNL